YKKGIFNPTKASNILKATKKENFFQAEHSILLHGNSTPFANYEALDKILEDEKTKIFADTELQEIQKQISNGAKAINAFESIIETYPDIITELEIDNIKNLKQKLWLSYYKKEEESFLALIELYKSTKAEIEEIEQKAQDQVTKWHEVVDEFKKRFSLPFEILITNKKSAILGKETPNIDFEFTDPISGIKKTFSRDSLGGLKVLSQGEKRALYLLYVIFELKGRIEDKTKTLIIIDDIADSFDYKNKYAIVEYLNEISSYDFFNQIILTHNFDFFRTVQERILMTTKWHNSLIVDKDNDESLKIVSAGSKNVTNPFEIWRKGYHNELSKFIALIPFVRNIIEYAHGTDGDEYKLLTSCLHIKKPDTMTITKKDIQATFETVGQLYQDKVIENENDTILDSIYTCADNIVASGKKDGIVLDDKIVLSIAIRLKAEEYMWSKVTDKSVIKGTQTGKLFKRFKDEYQGDDSFDNDIKVLTRMSIMTPENIHLNSFMYEPLLDMAYGHLVELYNDMKSL
ncbi:MAG: AAA family ATPase, partial [Sulfurimonas sp.]|uniref:AAA family ATPase n=1 Tax=Sulfurimonas sp. TaxID=2022749 RepID=UPI0028CE7DBA